MYRGTSAELRPIATPARKRPATITLRLVAAADSSGPASMGSAHSMKEVRRPNASAREPPVRLPTAAPARVLLTTCTTAAGEIHLRVCHELQGRVPHAADEHDVKSSGRTHLNCM
jgi:hypothetical protein